MAVAIAVSTAGCASSPSEPRAVTDFDPEERLEALLVEWRALPEPGRSCETTPRAREAVRDCGQLRAEFEALVLEFPRDPRVRLAAAAVARDASDRARALSHLDALLSVTPAQPEAAVLRARLAVEEGNLALARRVLREQIALAPAHAALREAEAGVLYLSGDRPGAYAALDAAEALGAPAWRVAYHRGLLEEGGGDRIRALDHYRAASEANPSFAPARERSAGLEAEGSW
jgi:Flp pilus assembly protein TadD